MTEPQYRELVPGGSCISLEGIDITRSPLFTRGRNALVLVEVDGDLVRPESRLKLTIEQWVDAEWLPVAGVGSGGGLDDLSLMHWARFELPSGEATRIRFAYSFANIVITEEAEIL